MRRVWKIPWHSHSSYLPHLVKVMEPRLWFEKRCISFVTKALLSQNKVVKYIAGMGRVGSYSVLGGNIRYLEHKYNLNEKLLAKCWSRKCDNMTNVIRTVEQIRELVSIRDTHQNNVLSRNECNEIIAFLCTS